MHETAYLNPNLTIIFINKRVGEEEEVTFHEENGIKAFISDMNKEKEKVTDIIYFKKEQDGIEVEIAFGTFLLLLNHKKPFPVHISGCIFFHLVLH